MIAANTSAVQMLNYQPAGKQKGDAKAGGGDFLAMLMNMQSDVGCRLSEAGRQISDIKENSGAKQHQEA
ncbi:hypothetical protein M1N64_01310, partial [Peptococcaceae bacterium]|nr:hypothetical protein [Peptococcaceae bacterium]